MRRAAIFTPSKTPWPEVSGIRAQCQDLPLKPFKLVLDLCDASAHAGAFRGWAAAL
jgi:hypothetical protein